MTVTNAAIIIIGDEVLAGNTIDTNSNFIAKELHNIGIKVAEIFTISDDTDCIKQALNDAFKITNLVITTGGLGPTKDDKTKKAIAHFFDDNLITDPETLAHLEQILINRNRAHLFDINRPQAKIPSKAKVIQNHNGTAPCLMMEENEKIAFVLPGVPYEVKPLIKDQIIPLLAERFSLSHLVVKIISVVDFPESLLAQTIEDWESHLPENIKLAYLPIGNRVKLKLTAIGNNKTDLEAQLNHIIEPLKPLIQDKVISWDNEDIASILKFILTKRGLSISTAESCTGGGISRLITSISGSSAYFQGGITAYAVNQKINILKVPKQLINQHTVVSEQVAEAMAIGCQELFKTDISISTTGVAGPQTDQYQNEIGSVYYSVRVKNKSYNYHLHLPHLDREDFMNFVSQRVLQSVVEVLVFNPNES
ncbi:CinA family nicotinamide mononucleotide deamidase-related protein [Riemerella anatipestifer]|uniref:CinA-like protein n=1 Tax=Riemerella anatipestifer (strain ATCC 11845 / DSM 15868 / JCM 9532 / NCTC 11014) TaxID=693978 RepID=E4T9N4_RIEAD|nr:CinA family nicotinamide mononucleotide deamidase-related protein [Riemerella anatipestifer]ADQ81715.1 competence/damage-inducible protein cinA [Riemerella anatipestifer ATCC 11845 = DSM 15868]ADZ12789.1 Uncharacterized protein (competence- and mitomycin-induced) [Riemerella anatipestifer RA-GD]AFD55725.1 competence/damage-inducible protein cina [Riemerella anatipestifer ATCC 11845 = DSM 15868]AGC40377.1 Uncharacterized protein (competence- and mitomycin-induced) [Riemerella anatipestifer RA